MYNQWHYTGQEKDEYDKEDRWQTKGNYKIMQCWRLEEGNWESREHWHKNLSRHRKIFKNL